MNEETKEYIQNYIKSQLKLSMCIDNYKLIVTLSLEDEDITTDSISLRQLEVGYHLPDLDW